MVGGQAEEFTVNTGVQDFGTTQAHSGTDLKGFALSSSLQLLHSLELNLWDLLLLSPRIQQKHYQGRSSRSFGVSLCKYIDYFRSLKADSVCSFYIIGLLFVGLLVR